MPKQKKKVAVKAHEVLQTGVNHMKDRETKYDQDSGERSMKKTVEMFNTLTGSDLSEEQGWKFMVCLKLVRSEYGNFQLDDYEDMAAYCGLAAEPASKKDK